MAVEKVLVPDIGDIDAVDVVEVLVAAGDAVAKEDPLITLESDKASMDVPSPKAGKVTEVKVKKGDRIGEGAVILLLEAEEDAGAGAAAARPAEGDAAGEGAPAREADAAEPEAAEAPSGEPPPASAEAPKPSEAAAPAVAAQGAEAQAAPAAGAAPPLSPAPVDEFAFSKAYASPAVRRYARELGADLSRVRGSGRKGRILKEDVQAFVKKSLAAPAAAPGAFALPAPPAIDFSKFGEVERQPLSRIQKISGPRLQAAWVSIPHVTQHDEADVTELEAFRQQHKAEAKAEGFSLTPLAFVMKAVVAALARFPTVNASLDPDGEHLVVKRYYHLGFAVDTPGGLVVPVIRDADRKGIFELARELAEVSAQARDGKLKPEQMRGASFTISSLGGIGGTLFTPIINPPEVAILGVSRSSHKPVWDGEAFAPRLMLPLSLSYDHRVIDGATAVRFTTHLCELLADLRRLLL